jgi:hypothetical protein
MKVKPLQALGLLSLLAIVVVGFFISLNRESKWPFVTPTATFTATQTSTVTQTSTPTPPPDLGHRAVTVERAGCFDWSNKRLADIDAFEQVSVLGTNRAGTWDLVKWYQLTPACWVETHSLKLNGFVHEELRVISEPFPPVSTPTPTSTLTFTPSPTFFTSLVDPTTTKKPTKTPKTPGPSPTSTSTSSPTPTPSSTPTITFTPTPSMTRTPTATLTPTLTPCRLPPAPALMLSNRGQNVDLSWNPVASATSYQVFRAVDSDEYDLLRVVTGTSFTDDLPNNVIHYYVVVTVNSCGESNRSNVLEISR